MTEEYSKAEVHELLAYKRRQWWGVWLDMYMFPDDRKYDGRLGDLEYPDQFEKADWIDPKYRQLMTKYKKFLKFLELDLEIVRQRRIEKETIADQRKHRKRCKAFGIKPGQYIGRPNVADRKAKFRKARKEDPEGYEEFMKVANAIN